MDEQTYDLNVNGHTVLNTKWVWGAHWPRERRVTEGWGASVEVPAVIELLDMAQNGKITLAQVRQTLVEGATALAETCDPTGAWILDAGAYLCAGDCDRCQVKRPELEQHREDAIARSKRYADHATYPYAAGNKTLHRAECPTVKDLGEENLPAAASDEEAFNMELRTYSHRGWTHFSSPFKVSPRMKLRPGSRRVRGSEEAPGTSSARSASPTRPRLPDAEVRPGHPPSGDNPTTAPYGGS